MTNYYIDATMLANELENRYYNGETSMHVGDIFDIAEQCQTTDRRFGLYSKNLLGITGRVADGVYVDLMLAANAIRNA